MARIPAFAGMTFWREGHAASQPPSPRTSGGSRTLPGASPNHPVRHPREGGGPSKPAVYEGFFRFLQPEGAWGLRGQRSGNSEADPVVAVRGIDPVAVGRAEVLWSVEPGTAAQNAGRRVEGILAPFPYIAMHLIKSPGIGLEAIDGNGTLAIFALLAATESRVAIIVRLCGRDFVAPPELGWCSSPATKLPFDFGRQAVALCCNLRESCAVGLCVLP